MSAFVRVHRVAPAEHRPMSAFVRVHRVAPAEHTSSINEAWFLVMLVRQTFQSSAFIQSRAIAIGRKTLALLPPVRSRILAR